jgi:2-oxo-4-hydroxy-4-carboxy-5-ureidoimidazoline decarboxylase
LPQTIARPIMPRHHDRRASMTGSCMPGLDHLNRLAEADFIRALDGIFEHAGWVPAAVAGRRPFGSVGALHSAMLEQLRHATPDRLLAFLNGHPDLVAGALPRDLTAASLREQSSAGLGAAAGAAALPALNQAYRRRFGFPFIICLRQHTAANTLRQLRQRLTHAPEAEQAAALAEITEITRLRLDALLPSTAPPQGDLALQVLQESGQAATGLRVALLQEGRRVAATTVADDGWLPLLPGGSLRKGHYALQLQLGRWFAARGDSSGFGLVPVPFVVTELRAAHRLALRIAPDAYRVQLRAEAAG